MKPDPRKGFRHYRQRQGEIAQHPFCARCQRRPAAEIHHIIPIAEGGDPYDAANRVPLCTACHRAEHRHPTFFLERT